MSPSSRRRLLQTNRPEDAPRQARTGSPDRDEAGVDRGALQRGDADRECDRAPGPAARGRLDPAAMPHRGPGRADQRLGRCPRHRNGRPCAARSLPCATPRSRSSSTSPRSSRNRSRRRKHWPKPSSPGSGSRRSRFMIRIRSQRSSRTPTAGALAKPRSGGASPWPSVSSTGTREPLILPTATPGRWRRRSGSRRSHRMHDAAPDEGAAVVRRAHPRDAGRGGGRGKGDCRRGKPRRGDERLRPNRPRASSPGTGVGGGGPIDLDHVRPEERTDTVTVVFPGAGAPPPGHDITPAITIRRRNFGLCGYRYRRTPNPVDFRFAPGGPGPGPQMA